MHGSLQAADVFAALSVFMSLRLALIMLPTSLAEWARCTVSFHRIEAFLALPEYNDSRSLPHDDDDSNDGDGVPATPAALHEQLLGRIGTPHAVEHAPATADSDSDRDFYQLVPCAFQWGYPIAHSSAPATPAGLVDSTGEFTLSNVSLRVRAGQMIGVTGTVGAGKSSLLCALLGEMPSAESICVGAATSSSSQQLLPSTAVVTRSVVYVGQKPFIMSTTLRDNICFGAPFSAARMETACAQAAMRCGCLQATCALSRM